MLRSELKEAIDMMELSDEMLYLLEPENEEHDTWLEDSLQPTISCLWNIEVYLQQNYPSSLTTKSHHSCKQQTTGLMNSSTPLVTSTPHVPTSSYQVNFTYQRSSNVTHKSLTPSFMPTKEQSNSPWRGQCNKPKQVFSSTPTLAK
jgi:hypothetical protein